MSGRDMKSPWRLADGELAEHGLAALRETFDRVYEAIYGYVHRHLDLEVMTVRLRASGHVPRLELARLEAPWAGRRRNTRAARGVGRSVGHI